MRPMRGGFGTLPGGKGAAAGRKGRRTARIAATLPLMAAVFFCEARAGGADSVFTRYLQASSIPLTENNSVVLLPSGREKFDDMFAAIRQAKSSVHLEYFNFRNDSIAAALFDILAEKAAQGVEVRALFDAFGNASNNRPISNGYVKRLRERGIEICKYDPMRFPWIDYALHRDHRKIVVIDGRIAYTGGMNVADYYISGTEAVGDWRDMHLRIEGEAVAVFQDIFLKIWNRAAKQSVGGEKYFPRDFADLSGFTGLKPDACRAAGGKAVAVVNREPRKTPAAIRNTFLCAINSAERSIQIVNPYFTLNRKIRKALERAVRRGVEVEIMVSENSDIPITPRVVEYTVRKLQKRGAEVYFYRGGFHHSKIMTVDGEYSFLGSANLNARSLAWDYECNVAVIDRCTAAEFRAIYEDDKRESCLKLTDEYWRTRPRWKKFQGWLFHFLRPFL